MGSHTWLKRQTVRKRMWIGEEQSGRCKRGYSRAAYITINFPAIFVSRDQSSYSCAIYILRYLSGERRTDFCYDHGTFDRNGATQ